MTQQTPLSMSHSERSIFQKVLLPNLLEHSSINIKNLELFLTIERITASLTIGRTITKTKINKDSGDLIENTRAKDE